jgi:hypothetical protein
MSLKTPGEVPCPKRGYSLLSTLIFLRFKASINLLVSREKA